MSTSPQRTDEPDGGGKPAILVLLKPDNFTNFRRLQGIAAYAAVHPQYDWRFSAWDRSIRDTRVDSDVDAVLAYAHDSELGHRLAKRDVPVVEISNNGHHWGLYNVNHDNRAIAVQAADFFLDRGFRDFAFVGWGDELFMHERQDGFVSSLEERGCDCRAFVRRFTWNRVQLRPQLVHWLRELPKPTALFARNDLTGRIVIEACAAAGLCVPEDIAVLGADDEAMVCETARVPLASIALNFYRIGELGAELLCSLLAGREPSGKRVLLPPRGITLRASADTIVVEDHAVRKAVAYIEQQARKGVETSAVAKHVGVSVSYLDDRFRGVLGQTLKGRIERLQVERARTLLLDGCSREQVAKRCGFSSPTQLSRRFKAVMDESPQAYLSSFQV